MGILATAGALGGAGQGSVEVGQQGQREQLLEKQNKLATLREQAIENLRSQHEAERQSAGIGAQEEMQSRGQEFEKGQTQTKIKAASSAAGATREFEAEQNKAKLASEEKRTGMSSGARVSAAQILADSRVKAAGARTTAKPRFEFHQAPTTNLDPKLGPVGVTSETLLYDHKNGAAYKLKGDRYIPAGMDEASLNRNVPSSELADLVRDPNGVIPSGPNKGMLKADAFQNTYHFLPRQVVSAWSQGQGGQAAGESSLPPNILKQVGAKSSTKIGEGFSPGEESNPDEGAADNAAQADEEESTGSPAFQSNAMSSYGNMAQ